MRNWFNLLAGIALAAAGYWIGVFAVRRYRRQFEESQQTLQRTQQLLAERAARVSTVEARLNGLQAQHDAARHSLERAVHDSETQRQHVAELQPLVAIRTALEQQLAGARRRIEENDACVAMLDETRNQLRLAEARVVAQQAQHVEKLSVLGQRLRERESAQRAAHSNEAATSKLPR